MWIVFCRLVPSSSNRLHAYLLTKVKEAPLYFYTATDSGITLNRFSQDLTLVDRSLPADFLKTSNNLTQCTMSAIFIAIGSKYMALLIPPSAVIIYLIQKFYLRTSRQLRHLDLETKSPLYTQFTETLNGLITVRAFGWQRDLQAEHHKLLQRSQRPYYVLFVIQRWLNLVLDLFVAGIAIILVVLTVFVHNIGPIGVSLIALISFNQQLSELINFWTSMETSIGAVARIRPFERVPSENMAREVQIPSPDWPLRGDLAMKSLSAGYELSSRPVLRHVSFSISAGKKLGICGRTGSGKSSLVLAILRMIEIQSGEIIIDGISLASLPRDLIRRKLTVIPQEPVLFRGTVRENVTGFTIVDDGKVLDTLGKVQLSDYIQSHGGLDAEIDNVPLSAGQRQLICLARAILTKQRILLLDEITSNVDDKTDDLMQEVIQAEFADCTIIAIAHRVHTLLNFDKIITIDDGRVVEYDTPSSLLKRTTSLFRQLYIRQRGKVV